jgi:hypothetical protein
MVETKAQSPPAQLNAFMAKYLPDVVATAKATLAKIRRCVPGATEFVYDNLH